MIGRMSPTGRGLRLAREGDIGMKGIYRGIVVGGDYWEIDGKDGSKLKCFTYKVLALDPADEKTKLSKDAKLLNVSAPSKDFESKFVYGAAVEFDGEFIEGFKGSDGKESKGKMKYTNMRLVKN